MTIYECVIYRYCFSEYTSIRKRIMTRSNHVSYPSSDTRTFEIEICRINQKTSVGSVHKLFCRKQIYCHFSWWNWSRFFVFTSCFRSIHWNSMFTLYMNNISYIDNYFSFCRNLDQKNTKLIWAGLVHLSMCETSRFWPWDSGFKSHYTKKLFWLENKWTLFTVGCTINRAVTMIPATNLQTTKSVSLFIKTIQRNTTPFNFKMMKNKAVCLKINFTVQMENCGKFFFYECSSVQTFEIINIQCWELNSWN